MYNNVLNLFMCNCVLNIYYWINIKLMYTLDVIKFIVKIYYILKILFINFLNNDFYIYIYSSDEDVLK